MRTARQALLLILFGASLWGCSSNTVYKETIDLPKGHWAYADSVLFTFDIVDTTRFYNLYLEVEHSIDFPFHNVYFQFFTGFPSGFRSERISSMELGSASGTWYGACKGEVCRVRIPIQTPAYFVELGAHTLSIRQHSRVEQLSGLYSLCFEVEDTGEFR
jgi:gliding motility-associated lipoprotein GldH